MVSKSFATKVKMKSYDVSVPVQDGVLKSMWRLLSPKLKMGDIDLLPEALVVNKDLKRNKFNVLYVFPILTAQNK